MIHYKRGETACAWGFFKAVTLGVEGDYESPSNGATVTIRDTDGTAKVTDGVMSEAAAGKWVYYYTIQSDDVLGEWTAEVTTQDGTGDGAKYVIKVEGFKVVA